MWHNITANVTQESPLLCQWLLQRSISFLCIEKVVGAAIKGISSLQLQCRMRNKQQEFCIVIFRCARIIPRDHSDNLAIAISFTLSLTHTDAHKTIITMYKFTYCRHFLLNKQYTIINFAMYNCILANSLSTIQDRNCKLWYTAMAIHYMLHVLWDRSVLCCYQGIC